MSPEQERIIRSMIQDVYTREVQLARFRRDVALWTAGVHPDRWLVGGLIDWGLSIAEMAERMPNQSNTEDPKR